MSQKLRLVFAVGLLMGLGAVAWAHREALVALFRNIDGHWAAAGFALYVLNYLLRSLRFCVLARESLPYWPTAVGTAAVHGLANYMLPMRTGDLSLPAVFRLFGQTAWKEGAAILVAARLLDFAALGSWLAIVALVPQQELGIGLRAVCGAVGLLFLSTVLLPRLLPLIGRWRRKGLFRWVASLEMDQRMGWYGFGTSLLVWACTVACFFAVCRAVGLTLGLGAVWFLVTVQIPMQLLPVQGLANAGNHEAGWVAGLALLGMAPGEGLQVAIATHGLLFAYVCCVGAAGLALLGLVSWQTRDGKGGGADRSRPSEGA